jgi:hypothetical protein
MAEFMSIMTRSQPNPPEALPTMADNFARQAILAKQEAKSRLDGLKTARQVTAYYETPIANCQTYIPSSESKGPS